MPALLEGAKTSSNHTGTFDIFRDLRQLGDDIRNWAYCVRVITNAPVAGPGRNGFVLAQARPSIAANQQIGNSFLSYAPNYRSRELLA